MMLVPPPEAEEEPLRMTRKMLVRVIAVIFMAGGIWSIITDPPWPKIFTPSGIEINLGDFVVGGILLSVGAMLFNFNEFGRKLALVLLSIKIIGSGFVALAAFSTRFFPQVLRADLSFSYTFFGQTYFHTEDYRAIALIAIGWFFIMLVIAIFLLQRASRALFSPKIKNDVEPVLL